MKGIDINSSLLEIAKKRVTEMNLTSHIDLCEMGVAELGSEESESYHIVMSGLCFSELTEDELRFTLREVRRILKLGGLLLIADEVRPKRISKSMLNWLIRVPLLIFTYLITQTTINAIKDLPEKIREAGFVIESVKLSGLENFIELVGRKVSSQ